MEVPYNPGLRLRQAVLERVESRLFVVARVAEACRLTIPAGQEEMEREILRIDGIRCQAMSATILANDYVDRPCLP